MTPSRPAIAPGSEGYGFYKLQSWAWMFRTGPVPIALDTIESQDLYFNADYIRMVKRQAAACQIVLWKLEQKRIAAEIKKEFPRKYMIEYRRGKHETLKAAHKAAHDNARAWEEWGNQT